MFKSFSVSEKNYTGVQLTPNYFRGKDERFKTHESTIAYWNSSVDVESHFMKDIDDVRDDLIIRANNMSNFIIEYKNTASPLELVLIQRVFTRVVQQTVNNHLRAPILYIDGNDIKYQVFGEDRPYKFSVSIAVRHTNVGLIHFGYNVDSIQLDQVQVGSLEHLQQFTGESVHTKQQAIQNDILSTFIEEMKDCLTDAYKAV